MSKKSRDPKFKTIMVGSKKRKECPKCGEVYRPQNIELHYLNCNGDLEEKTEYSEPNQSPEPNNSIDKARVDNLEKNQDALISNQERLIKRTKKEDEEMEDDEEEEDESFIDKHGVGLGIAGAIGVILVFVLGFFYSEKARTESLAQVDGLNKKIKDITSKFGLNSNAAQTDLKTNLDEGFSTFKKIIQPGGNEIITNQINTKDESYYTRMAE